MIFERAANLEEVKDLVFYLQTRPDVMFSVDVETTGFSPRKNKLVGVGVSYSEGRAVYIPLGHLYEQPFDGEAALSLLRPLFEERSFCAFNAAFDVAFLQKQGRMNIDPANVVDVQLLAHAKGCYPSLSLSAIAKQEINMEVWRYSDFMRGEGLTKKQTIAEAKITSVVEYCGRDVLATLCLYNKLYSKWKDNSIYKLERRVLPVVMQMIENGVLVNQDFFKKEAERLSLVMADLQTLIEVQCSAAAGEQIKLNLGSPQQLAHVLFDILKLEPAKITKTGQKSTDESVLLELRRESPVVNNILAHRGISKRTSSFIDEFMSYCDKDGRIRTKFNQTGVPTGRFSSADPNLQNIPNESSWLIYRMNGEKEKIVSNVRQGFIVPPGKFFVCYDFNQIELRLAAGVTQEAVLLASYRDGIDTHTKTASLVFGIPVTKVTKEQRRIGKKLNFTLLYGGGPRVVYAALKKDLDISREQAKEFRERYVEGYPKMFREFERIADEAERNGYIKTLFGRTMHVFEFQSEDQKMRERGRRVAYNGVIQGTAADIMKISMVRISDAIKKRHWDEKKKMLLTVHDDLAFEVDGDILSESIQVVLPLMEFKFPKFPDIFAEVKVGRDWGNLKEFKSGSLDEFLSQFMPGGVPMKEVSGKTFVLDLPEKVERGRDNVEAFRKFLKDNPGSNKILVRIGPLEKVMPFTTSIGLESRERILLMMGGNFYER